MPANDASAPEAAARAFLTIEQFAGREGETFYFLCTDKETDANVVRIALKLFEVRDLSGRTVVGLDAAGHPLREPFSLLFRGSRENQLAGGIFEVEHAELGRLQFYSAPVQLLLAQGNEDVICYESIFN